MWLETAVIVILLVQINLCYASIERDEMNWSILLAILGITVSVLIGLGTFYAADKRSRRHRYSTARNLILQDLTKSLSEDNIPSYRIVQSTIRSVLRNQGYMDFSGISIDEIVDDLIRQITSDPFLDSNRRAHLQQEVLKISTPPVAEKVPSDLEAIEPPEKVEVTKAPYVPGEFWSRILSVTVGVITSVVVGITLLEIISIEKIVETFKNNLSDFSAILVGVAGLITAITASLLLIKRKG